jgi:hypothetical protein
MNYQTVEESPDARGAQDSCPSANFALLSNKTLLAGHQLAEGSTIHPGSIEN